MISIKNIPIGQYLKDQKLITEKQLKSVLDYQKQNPAQDKFFGDYVVELGYITEFQFAKALADNLGVPFVDLNETKIDIFAVKKIPELLAKKYSVV